MTDPIGYEDGPNWYLYVHDDPINGTDPTGDLDPFGAVVGGTYGFVVGGISGYAAGGWGTAAVGAAAGTVAGAVAGGVTDYPAAVGASTAGAADLAVQLYQNNFNLSKVNITQTLAAAAAGAVINKSAVALSKVAPVVTTGEKIFWSSTVSSWATPANLFASVAASQAGAALPCSLSSCSIPDTDSGECGCVGPSTVTPPDGTPIPYQVILAPTGGDCRNSLPSTSRIDFLCTDPNRILIAYDELDSGKKRVERQLDA